MKTMRPRNSKRPLFLQMVVAGIVSLFSISFATCAWIIFSLAAEGNTLNIDRLSYAISSLLFVIILVCVPVSLSSLLLIHLTGIFKNVMFSFKMVVLESLLLVSVNILLNIIADGFYIKSILSVSVIMVVCVAFFIKKILHSRYLCFQNKLDDLITYPLINMQVDIKITVAANIVLLIPSLLFVFTCF